MSRREMPQNSNPAEEERNLKAHFERMSPGSEYLRRAEEDVAEARRQRYQENLDDDGIYVPELLTMTDNKREVSLPKLESLLEELPALSTKHRKLVEMSNSNRGVDALEVDERFIPSLSERLDEIGLRIEDNRGVELRSSKARITTEDGMLLLVPQIHNQFGAGIGLTDEMWEEVLETDEDREMVEKGWDDEVLMEAKLAAFTEEEWYGQIMHEQLISEAQDIIAYIESRPFADIEGDNSKPSAEAVGEVREKTEEESKPIREKLITAIKEGNLNVIRVFVREKIYKLAGRIDEQREEIENSRLMPGGESSKSNPADPYLELTLERLTETWRRLLELDKALVYFGAIPKFGEKGGVPFTAFAEIPEDWPDLIDPGDEKDAELLRKISEGDLTWEEVRRTKEQ